MPIFETAEANLLTGAALVLVCAIWWLVRWDLDRRDRNIVRAHQEAEDAAFAEAQWSAEDAASMRQQMADAGLEPGQAYKVVHTLRRDADGALADIVRAAIWDLGYDNISTGPDEDVLMVAHTARVDQPSFERRLLEIEDLLSDLGWSLERLEVITPETEVLDA